MDIFVFTQQRVTQAKEALLTFRGDVLRLLRASPLFGGMVVATGVVFGVAPIALWQYVGKFIDACFGARGIGTMTTDLSHSAIMVLCLGVLLALACGYFVQTQALARSIATTIALWGVGISHSIVIWPVQKSFLIFLCIIALGIAVARHRAAVWCIKIVLGLLTFTVMADILKMMIHRSMTVGSAIEYCLVVLALAAMVAWKYGNTQTAYMRS